MPVSNLDFGCERKRTKSKRLNSSEETKECMSPRHATFTPCCNCVCTDLFVENCLGVLYVYFSIFYGKCPNFGAPRSRRGIWYCYSYKDPDRFFVIWKLKSGILKITCSKFQIAYNNVKHKMHASSLGPLSVWVLNCKLYVNSSIFWAWVWYSRNCSQPITRGE